MKVDSDRNVANRRLISGFLLSVVPTHVGVCLRLQYGGVGQGSFSARRYLRFGLSTSFHPITLLIDSYSVMVIQTNEGNYHDHFIYWQRCRFYHRFFHDPKNTTVTRQRVKPKSPTNYRPPVLPKRPPATPKQAKKYNNIVDYLYHKNGMIRNATYTSTS